MTGPAHVPVPLGTDAELNRAHLQKTLDSAPGGTLLLPAGTYPLAHGLTVPAGWTVGGTPPGPDSAGPVTWLTVETPGDRPVLHVVGSGVSLLDLGLRPAPSRPGEHDGDRGTGLTVGRYLYPDAPDWIGGIEIRRVHVDHGANRAANAVAIMGAVRDTTVEDVTVTGGHTGVAVHWGAIGASVDTIVGPSYHPHRLRLSGLRVRDAVEGFYLSAVHDVEVAGACLRGVDMGFRLLAGDNTDRFHRDPQARICERIEIRDVCVTWTGPLYGVRVAGWGRSEVDGLVSRLEYVDTAIRDTVLRRLHDKPGTTTGTAQRGWSPLLMEHADTVVLDNVRLTSTPPTPPCCPHSTP
ncbi:hypothetical protein AWW66_29825 [Micromonospora rosaria]|uniref:Pectate lyase superfamily protein domain-containing protein n=1 Tax=Micromonospora rosaria TaxID=47874 RepID=A0A136PJ58_9ACTN|nr:hypothetical protein [Micromonospora rosaria]KXK58434.1 hypothetical protein AWW66_29825 [Micromonospora rosaria]